MSDIFVAVTGEDGAVTYQPAPEEVVVGLVKGHSLYTSVLDESIQRRKENATLKAAKPESVTPEAAASVAPPTPASPIDVAALSKQITDKVLADLAATQQKDQERRVALDGAVKKFKLPDNPQVRQILAMAPNPDEAADLLAKSGLQLTVDPISGASAGPDFSQRVLQRMGLA